jgi:hypothetical protein
MLKATASFLALALLVAVAHAQVRKKNNTPKIPADTIAGDFKKDPAAAEKKYGGGQALFIDQAEVKNFDENGVHLKNSAGIDLFVKTTSRQLDEGNYTAWVLEGKFVSFKNNVLTIEGIRMQYAKPFKQ